MEQPSRLYNALVVFVGQSGQWADKRHMYTLVWMVVGLLAEGCVNLTCWIPSVQTKAQYAQSTQRRFQRWLNNPRINVQRLYSPLIKGVLSGWEDEVIYLSLDTSTLWSAYCIIRLCVVYRGRAIPVGWRVLEHRSSSVKFGEYRALLKRVSQLMPEGVKVVFLADRGFVDSQLVKFVRQDLQWGHRIRVKGSFWLWKPGRGSMQVHHFHLAVGEAIMLHNVRMHKTDTIEGGHLALARENINGELWYIFTDAPPTLQTLYEYGLRFDIEENFLDDKSNGFNLESSQIRSAMALSRLCLVLSVATLYLSLQGTAVVASGKRRFVDPHWFRGNSYFRIGWNWIKTALSRGWKLFELNFLSTNTDPEPAMASYPQHYRQHYSLEFTVRSYDYAC